MNAPREQVTALLTAMGVTGAEEDRLLDIICPRSCFQ